MVKMLLCIPSPFIVDMCDFSVDPMSLIPNGHHSPLKVGSQHWLSLLFVPELQNLGLIHGVVGPIPPSNRLYIDRMNLRENYWLTSSPHVLSSTGPPAKPFKGFAEEHLGKNVLLLLYNLCNTTCIVGYCCLVCLNKDTPDT